MEEQVATSPPFVTGSYLTYAERLKECGLTTLETRILRGIK